MQSAAYYRSQAQRARRLAQSLPGDPLREQLECIAHDLDNIAIDLERGLIEIRRADLLPQHQE